MRIKRAAIVILVGLAATAASAAAAAPRTITVNGTGIVTSAPNQAQFSFGVSTTAGSATAALAANAKKMTAVIGVLKSLGIPAHAIQTSDISVTPNRNQAGTKVVDYSATNTVTATTGNIAASGKIIDAAVRDGANLVDGPTLSRSDQTALSRQALRAAFADARARAGVLAAAAHVTLGRVRSISESSGGPITTAESPTAKSFASTPVEAGTIQTESDITVTFDIA